MNRESAPHRATGTASEKAGGSPLPLCPGPLGQGHPALSPPTSSTSACQTNAASATYETQEVSKWELDGYNNPQPVLSTLTGRDSSGNEISSGTFRLEHLQPTTSTVKFLVFIGTTSNAIIPTIAVQDAADANVPPATWYQENLASAQRRHSWALVDVSANTTTFLQNFNLPTE